VPAGHAARSAAGSAGPPRPRTRRPAADGALNAQALRLAPSTRPALRTRSSHGRASPAWQARERPPTAADMPSAAAGITPLGTDPLTVGSLLDDCQSLPLGQTRLIS